MGGHGYCAEQSPALTRVGPDSTRRSHRPSPRSWSGWLRGRCPRAAHRAAECWCAMPSSRCASMASHVRARRARPGSSLKRENTRAGRSNPDREPRLGHSVVATSNGRARPAVTSITWGERSSRRRCSQPAGLVSRASVGDTLCIRGSTSADRTVFGRICEGTTCTRRQGTGNSGRTSESESTAGRRWLGKTASASTGLTDGSARGENSTPTSLLALQGDTG